MILETELRKRAAKAQTRPMPRSVAAFALAAVIVFATGLSARADISVDIAGPGGRASQTLPAAGGAFEVDLPLAKNSVNSITVTASDALGNQATGTINVTQVSLADVVISEFSSEPLSPERIEQLVQDGVIDLADPENYNVSEFRIVLTIGKQTFPISVPIVSAKGEGEPPSGFENIPLPWGADSGSGKLDIPPVEIIAFQQSVAGPPGEPAPPPIPGVLIIEGRIKSLKEFYSCRLLLMNASGIFTLSDVVAKLEFPDGGLTSILPADGIVSFGDILPGDGAQPGQVEKEFIIRGDTIGVRRVKVGFGGLLTGPGIPEDGAIPFNGSAVTTVEVKGPPSFDVQVFHPREVIAGVPYDLRVDVTNTGDMPALYASIELDAGGDGRVVECSYDIEGGIPDCVPIDGPSVRSLGHVFPGKTVSQFFTIEPFKSGQISSCMGMADQNISLQVYAGNLGCVTGQTPDVAGMNGMPAVSVLPTHNALNISTESPVVAFFSERMNHGSITTGAGGSFNVYDESGNVLPGELRFDTLGEGAENEKTVAIWQFRDNLTNRLPANSEFVAILTQGIRDEEGNGLFSQWSSTFTTTGEGYADDDPPGVTLSVEPPVLPSLVLPGELVRVNAYTTDQGSGVSRVEARLKDLDVAGSAYELIDTRSIQADEWPPHIFTIDSGNLEPGHTYRILVTAYDFAANVQDATLSLVIAATADPPTIVLPEDPVLPKLQGISMDVTPKSYSGGVREVLFYLDGMATPFHTATLRPYQAHARTLELALGTHSVRAVAVDGLGQTGEDTLTFELVENLNMPVVAFGSAVDGVQHAIGSSFVVNITVEDPVGIASVQAFLDGAKADPITTGSSSFVIKTSEIGLGDHRITVIATNRLGISNDPGNPDSVLTFSVVNPPPGSPPEAPQITQASLIEDNLVFLQGTTRPKARVDVTNTALGLTTTVFADGAGVFSANLPGEAGHEIRAVAYDFSQSPDPSAPGIAIVSTPPTLTQLEVVPASVSLTAINATATLTVTGHYSDSSTKDLSSAATYASNVPAVASVNAAGRIVALTGGNATVTVKFGGLEVQVPVSVDVVMLTHITVAPVSLSFTTPGESTQLTVTGHFSDGSTAPYTALASYASGNLAVAIVSPGGLAQAVAQGQSVISVAVSGVSPLAVPVTVNTGADTPPTATITSPADGTEVERGETVVVNVKADDAVGGVTRIDIQTTGQTSHSDFAQISPAATTATRQFSFVVSAGAAVGGPITVSAWATDGAGQTSDTQTIVLTVVDDTAPSTAIDAPASLTGYNYGDTVTVEISATDAVGVAQIRYVTAGALIRSGSQTIDPPTTTASATFTFHVPYGVADPDVAIRAYASDAAGNEGAAVPVNIVLTDADITPPETEATGVTSPGAGATTVVSYQVLDGLDDLDRVELYFRRGGAGTFNRYTDAAGGNPLGHFHPQSGATGTLVFDSTRMGGDGAYEFYTVGVDETGNRESAPDDGAKTVVADQQATFNAGTVWTVINTAQTIDDGDATYDGVNLRIDGAQVTMNGTHGFHNVELVNGATIRHPETTTTTEYALGIQAWTLTLDGSSAINVDARGYLGGRHAENSGADDGRTLANALGSTYRSGGSYGGPGAIHDAGVPNAVYGNLVDPVELGSGGSDGSSNTAGGDGGGRILLEAINLVNDGVISANGESGHGNGAGSGSGGSIKVVASTVSGGGPIRANGGAYEVGGGGGRIAIHYVDISTLNTALVQSLGGLGSWAPGGNGTVFLKSVSESNGSLVFDGQGASTTFSTLPIPPGFVFDNITIRNNARVLIDDSVAVTDTIQVLANSILSHSTTHEDGLHIQARRVVVDATSAIDVSGRGYPGGRAGANAAQDDGLTLGGILGARYRSGGSYGGYGGVHDGSGCNPPYGHAASPIHLGSGGSDGASNTAGGHGGGRVTLLASDEVVVDGVIRANGATGAGNGAGSGSGGSVLIETSMLRGSGMISANGAAYEVGGGGGRIAIVYEALGDAGDDLGERRNITAFGGKGGWVWGSAGTVLLRRADQPHGDLYIDDNLAGATTSNWTPLTRIGPGTIVDLTTDTLTVDGNIPITPDGLVGLEINPNIEQSETYVVVSNTATTLTVDTAGKAQLTSVAGVGDTYMGVNRFDNVLFRRGGYLVTGDALRVAETMLIDEYGRLDHYDATITYEPWLDMEVGDLVVTGTSAIDVSARGYLGGRRASNSGQDSGRTLDNALGSTSRSGGSHGGRGGNSGGTPNTVYGDPTSPVCLGSGGSDGASDTPGGDGGGRVNIVARTVNVDGVIAANGANGSGNGAGSGSGGAINIHAQHVLGNGYIRVNGAGYEVGGGGGRIAIRYSDLDMNTAHLQAFGGQGSWAGGQGGNGTVFLKGAGQTRGDLVIDGSGGGTPSESSPITFTMEFDNIVLRNNARVVSDVPLHANDKIEVLTGSVLTHSLSREPGLRVEARRVFVDATSAIDVSGRGYPGGRTASNSTDPGITLGGAPGANYRSGGSYGGYGGIHDGSGTNPPYGHPAMPVYLGSGGSDGASSTSGGHGGGRIAIVASDEVQVEGAVRANGNSGAGNGAGSGSGGSVLIETALLHGAGSITANGGAYEVGGGGGRVAVVYQTIGGAGDDLNNLRNIQAFGGHAGWVWGSAGTVLLRQASQAFGDLYIDDNVAGSTTSNWTPLTRIGLGRIVDLGVDTLTVDGNVPMTPGGLAGIELNPNVEQEQTLTILTNTATTITVGAGGPDLTTIAGIGDLYAGVYRFDNVYFRRGGYLVTSDQLRVGDTMLLDEYGRLGHFDATLTYEPGIDLEVGTLDIVSTGGIDVSGRGYLGGRHSANSAYDQGRALGNVLGATIRSGGSYGGYGAQVDSGITNPPYGHPGAPLYLGAGGSDGASDTPGGDGGGRVRIVAGTEVIVDGGIWANGENGRGNGAGSGAGGSIHITTPALSGTGTIAANGAAYEVGGGGGRIAIVYDTLGAAGDDLGGLRNIVALGGHGGWAWGSAGTVVMRHSGQLYGDLYIDDNVSGATTSNWTPLTRIGYGQIVDLTDATLTLDGNVPVAPGGLVGLELRPNIDDGTTFLITANTATTVTVADNGGVVLTDVAAIGDTYTGLHRFDNVYFRNGGYLVIGDQLDVQDTMRIDEHGRLDHFDATITYEARIDLSAGNLEVAQTGAIDAGGRGYLGGRRLSNAGFDDGRTLGNALGSVYRSGGSYGGLGAPHSGGIPNPVYGDPANPAALGSGGSDGASNTPGGDGGGWVKISADTVVVDGTIAVNGESGRGNGAGSGSGGTVNIVTGAFSGAGVIQANGGAYEVSGGGGRVAVYYSGASSDLTSLIIQSLGGNGSWTGLAQDCPVYYSDTSR